MIEESADLKITGDRKAASQKEMSYWTVLTVASSIYCIIAFIAGAMMAWGSEFNAPFFAAILFSEVQLTSIIAALGPGSYWRRLAITQGWLVLITFSYVGGSFIVSPRWQQPELVYMLLAIITLGSVGAQFFYGIFRLTRGWRFHFPSTERGPAYSLQDLFAMTLYLAVAISITNRMFFSDNSRESAPIALIYFTCFLAGTVLYGLPTLLTIFSLREAEHGFFAQLIIVVTVGFLLIMPLMALGVTAGIVVMLVVFICSCSLFTSLPLAMMHKHGFVLTNGKEKPERGQ